MIAIYKIENQKTGNCYIGSSKNPIGRWKSHLRMLQDNRHHQNIQKEWNDSQISDWTFCILKLVPRSMRAETEHFYFKKFKPQLNGDRDKFVCIERKDIVREQILYDIAAKVPYRKICVKHGVALGTITAIKQQNQTGVF